MALSSLPPFIQDWIATLTHEQAQRFGISSQSDLANAIRQRVEATQHTSVKALTEKAREHADEIFMDIELGKLTDEGILLIRTEALAHRFRVLLKACVKNNNL